MRIFEYKLLAAVAIAGTAVAGNAWAFDNLAEAYQSALRSDRMFLSAEAQQRSVMEKLPQARAGLLPVINVTGSRTNYDGQVSYAGGQFQNIDRQFMVKGWTLSINQPLFRMANFLQYGRAQLQVEQSYVQLDMARYDLLGRLSNAFLDWQVALRTKEAADMTKRYADALAEQSRSRLDLRLATVPDSLDVEARFRKAEADASAADGDLRVKAAALSRVVGELPPSTQFSFKPLPWPEVKGVVEQWVDQAKYRNLQVRYQTLQVAIADKDVNAARSAHLPTINLVMNKSSMFNSGSTSVVDGATANTQNLASIGIQLDMPIFSGGLANSRADEAIAFRDKAREDLENAKEGAGVDTLNYFYKASSGLLQMLAAEKRVQAAESQLSAMKSGVLLRTRLDLDALGARAAWLAAQRDFFRAQADTMMAVLQLRMASGELADDDIAVWSALLIPVGPSAGR